MIVANANAVSMREESRQWLKAFLYVGLILALLMAVQSAYATDGTEFEAAATKFESWVKGNLGKLAALVAVAVGSVVAAVRKDWSWFFGALVLAIGIGIVVGIVNASFTAVI
jgi:conjugal transfer pilus assembly protein TraA